MITEIESKQLQQMLDDGKSTFALFVYTPFCGTCKLAEQLMRSAVSAFASSRLGTDNQVPTIYKVNINVAPKLAQSYRIKSVPCFMVWNNGTCTVQEYALGSMKNWLKWLQMCSNHR